MSTKIISCTCQHTYQDARYGQGRRVANEVPGGKSTPPSWRCTVCGTKVA